MNHYINNDSIQRAMEERKKNIILIDPPSGWMYGFPKHYDNPDNLPLEEWLLANGYPQHEIDNAGVKHCRFIGTNVGELEINEGNNNELERIKQ